MSLLEKWKTVRKWQNANQEKQNSKTDEREISIGELQRAILDANSRKAVSPAGANHCMRKEIVEEMSVMKLSLKIISI